jgi:hypothetical protein
VADRFWQQCVVLRQLFSEFRGPEQGPIGVNLRRVGASVEQVGEDPEIWGVAPRVVLLLQNVLPF